MAAVVSGTCYSGRDTVIFVDVVGISLLSCTFRLRRKAGNRWQRRNLTAEPHLSPARTCTIRVGEHSIPGVESRRYSITFRNVLEKAS